MRKSFERRLSLSRRLLASVERLHANTCSGASRLSYSQIVQAQERAGTDVQALWKLALPGSQSPRDGQEEGAVAEVQRSAIRADRLREEIVDEMLKGWR